MNRTEREEKRCTQCKGLLPLDEFYAKYSECKRCNSKRSSEYQKKNRQKIFATKLAWRNKNKSLLKDLAKRRSKTASKRIRDADVKLRSTYGISQKDYDNLLDKQNGVCAICKKAETKRTKGTLCRLSVDHDHSCCSGRKSCGKCVAGLLCSKCNRILGLLKDNPETIKNLLEYVINTRITNDKNRKN